MPDNPTFPDYELEDARVVASPIELKAMSDPTRSAILDLLVERAATVAELASALGRPKSTIAHHVNVLLAADLLRVVRTRRVRAIDERSYGRTARVFKVGMVNPADEHAPPTWPNPIAVAAAESAAAHEADTMRAIHRHVRIAPDRADEFWDRVLELAHELNQLPRSGETSYGFVAGLYPSDHPALPDAPPS